MLAERLRLYSTTPKRQRYAYVNYPLFLSCKSASERMSISNAKALLWDEILSELRVLFDALFYAEMQQSRNGTIGEWASRSLAIYRLK